MKTAEEQEDLTCHNCGHTGKDVGWHLGYVGGQGLVKRPECNDILACTKRWNIKNGLPENYTLEGLE